MTKFLQCISVFLALLLLTPLGKAAAGDDVGISVVKDLLAQLWDSQNGKTGDRNHLGFDIPEILVNQYIAYLIESKTRLGVKEARIKVVGKNRVNVSCDLDLQQIKAWESTALGGALAGKSDLPVNATTSIDITNGMAKVSVLSASDPSGKIELATIRELFRIIAAHQPEHFDMDKPIKLPFNLTIAMADGVFYGKTPLRAPR